MNITNTMKLMAVALAVGPLGVMAEEAAQPAAPAAAEVKPAEPGAQIARPKMTEAQRAEMRARREKFMAERKAKMEAKMLEVVKKYIPEEDKAKALVKELQESMMGMRRPPMGNRLPAPKREPAPAAK